MYETDVDTSVEIVDVDVKVEMIDVVDMDTNIM